MNYAGIDEVEIANGEGVGVTLFVSGCPFHCKGCFNQEAWDYDYGNKLTWGVMEQIMDLANKSYIQRISILGGEPLAKENVIDVGAFIMAVHRNFRDKKIWLYTGYTYEELSPAQLVAASYADVLVDGRFIEKQKDLQLKFRGSRNQRVIDIAAMRAAGDWDNIIIRKGYEIEGNGESTQE